MAAPSQQKSLLINGLAAWGGDCCRAALDIAAALAYLVGTRRPGVLTGLGPAGIKSNMEVGKMKFRPLQDRVLIRRLDQEEKTAGGIIIPDTAKEKPMEGEVMAVGPGARSEDGTLHPLDVKVGDRVLFGKWSGTEVKVDGEDVVIMKESDILGVIEGGTAKRKAA